MIIVNSQYDNVLGTVAAGTDDVVVSNGIDVSHTYESAFVVFVGSMAQGAEAIVHLQASDDDETYVDLSGSALSLDDQAADKHIVLMARSVQFKYVRVSITRSVANVSIERVFVVRRRLSTAPVTHSSDTVATVLVALPQQGDP